jgi:enediyne polyketide synthase
MPTTSLSVAVIRSTKVDRRQRSARAIQTALGEQTEILHRTDGKPEVCGGRFVSASHNGELTLGVAGADAISCDLEGVVERSESGWFELLGQQNCELAKLISKTVNEDPSISATRVWTARECLRKFGAAADAALTLKPEHADRWVFVLSGGWTIATYATEIRGQKNVEVFALLARSALTGLGPGEEGQSVQRLAATG